MKTKPIIIFGLLVSALSVWVDIFRLGKNNFLLLPLSHEWRARQGELSA